MMPFHKRDDNDWRLWPVIFDLIQSNRHASVHMFLWLGIDFVINSITTYATVSFFSSANLRMLCLLLFCQTSESFIGLKARLVKKTFVLACVHRLHIVIPKRLLRTDWYRLKVSDHTELRRKIDEAAGSVQIVIEYILDELTTVYDLISAMLTIAVLCPWEATLGLLVAYILFFLVYVQRRSKELLAIRVKHNATLDELHAIYDRIVGRSLDYVLHGEEAQLIETSSALQVSIEGLWFVSEYFTTRLSFAEGLFGKLCTLVIICILIGNSSNPIMIIPIYHYLSSLVRKLDSIINVGIRCIRLIKDYEVLQPLLEEYQPRYEAVQLNMEYSLTIESLHFTYQQAKTKRKRFTLELCQPITCQVGEVVLVTGNSGAGKSTFYDIISGCISKEDYTAIVIVDNHLRLPDSFHNLESLRTLVLQDTQMDFKCSIFTMITDVEENVNNRKEQEEENEERVWRFLRLVEIDSFVRDSLDGQLHVPVENRLSGGQKTRLMLARALNRAEQRQSRILILDEPDRGLPSETTFRIMLNIVRWFGTKGILLLTLHNDRVREKLPLDHILHIEHGRIQSIATDLLKDDTVA